MSSFSGGSPHVLSAAAQEGMNAKPPLAPSPPPVVPTLPDSRLLNVDTHYVSTNQPSAMMVLRPSSLDGSHRWRNPPIFCVDRMQILEWFCWNHSDIRIAGLALPPQRFVVPVGFFSAYRNCHRRQYSPSMEIVGRMAKGFVVPVGFFSGYLTTSLRMRVVISNESLS